jgi:hypothetical protein
MDDAVEDLARLDLVLAAAEHSAPQRWPVQRPTFPGWTILSTVADGVVRRQEQVWHRGREVVDYCFVSRRARLDDLARENIGVDDGQRVGRGAEDL